MRTYHHHRDRALESLKIADGCRRNDCGWPRKQRRNAGARLQPASRSEKSEAEKQQKRESSKKKTRGLLRRNQTKLLSPASAVGLWQERPKQAVKHELRETERVLKSNAQSKLRVFGGIFGKNGCWVAFLVNTGVRRHFW